MTTTAPAPKKPAAKKSAAANKAATKPAGVGRISRVTGPVVDIEFPHDAIPEMYNALKTTITIGADSNEITLEVAQHLGDDVVRAISLNPTDGLVLRLKISFMTGMVVSAPFWLYELWAFVTPVRPSLFPSVMSPRVACSTSLVRF